MRAAETGAVARRAAAIVTLAALACAAGCAPHVTELPGLEPSLRAERYQAALTAREARAMAVDAEVLLWAEAPLGEKLPGAEGRVLLAAPDAFRLRVSSLFGTALDLGCRGDSLAAYVPSRRRGLSVDAIRDSLGIARPGSLVCRALAATWRPPPEAWDHAIPRGGALEVRWREGEDSLSLAVADAGLPARATFKRPAGGGVRVEYKGWEAGSGISWPSRFVVTDLEGGFRIACKVSRVRFQDRADSLRLAVPIPADAVPLTLAELRRTLQRMGAL